MKSLSQESMENLFSKQRIQWFTHRTCHLSTTLNGKAKNINSFLILQSTYQIFFCHTHGKVDCFFLHLLCTLDLVRVTMAGWHGTLDRDTWPSLVGRHRQLEFPYLAELILDLGDKNVDYAGCSIETMPPVKRVILDRLVLEHGSKMLLDWVYYVVRKPIVFKFSFLEKKKETVDFNL